MDALKNVLDELNARLKKVDGWEKDAINEYGLKGKQVEVYVGEMLRGKTSMKAYKTARSVVI